MKSTLTFETILTRRTECLASVDNSDTASQAQAAANPIINLQVAVSFAESDRVFCQSGDQP